MTREPIPGRVMLTHENVQRIIEVAAKRKFTLEDLVDTIDYHAEYDEEVILFTSVYPWNKQISNFNAVPYNPEYHNDAPCMTTDEFIALLETTPEVL